MKSMLLLVFAAFIGITASASDKDYKVGQQLIISTTNSGGGDVLRRANVVSVSKESGRVTVQYCDSRSSLTVDTNITLGRNTCAQKTPRIRLDPEEILGIAADDADIRAITGKRSDNPTYRQIYHRTHHCNQEDNLPQAYSVIGRTKDGQVLGVERLDYDDRELTTFAKKDIVKFESADDDDKVTHAYNKECRDDNYTDGDDSGRRSRRGDQRRGDRRDGPR
jgi:hypothetical protein